MDLKSFIVPVLAGVCLIFMIASAATPWLNYGNAKYGIIETCSPQICVKASLGCKSRDDLRNADAAFTIMACLFIGFATILAILRLFVAQLMAPPLKMATFILCAVTIFCSLLSWIFAFALYDAEMCNSKISDLNGAEVGPQGPLALIAFIIAIVATIVEFVMGSPFAGGGAAPAAASASSE